MLLHALLSVGLTWGAATLDSRPSPRPSLNPANPTLEFDVNHTKRPDREEAGAVSEDQLRHVQTEDGNVPGESPSQTVPGRAGNTFGTGGKPIHVPPDD